MKNIFRKNITIADKGFTLIELMIAIAIIATLTTIAIPSYKNYLKKINRSDATTSLLQLLNKQELFYNAQDARYTLNVSELGYTTYLGNDTQTISNQEHYILSLSTCGAGIESCILLTATAAAASTQAEDFDCFSISLNSIGQKESTNVQGNTTENCW